MPNTTTTSSSKKLRVPKIKNRPLEHRDPNGHVRKEETQEFIQKAALLTPSERDQLLTPSEKVKAHHLKTQIEEQVRARCTIDLLDRAGVKPVEKVQHLKAPRTPEEVEAELAAIVGKDQAEILLGKRKMIN